MAFPGPYASIIRNEEGEVLGWDNHYYDEEPYEPDEDRDIPPTLLDPCQECHTTHYDDESCDDTIEEGDE